jgi:NhaP-type Na+/H+ or K+/H+ antiporter
VSFVAIFITLLFLYTLVSGRMEKTVVTAPIVFAAGGMLCCLFLPRLGEGGMVNIFSHVAEIGLVLLLFTDAARTDLSVLKSIRALSARLLSVGMLLTIVLGAALAKLVFPQLSIWEAGILASILAPTDAGLGQVIVNSPNVPLRVRQALNVEAGLNDGLSVPFLLFFIALSGSEVGEGSSTLLGFMWEQLGLGTLIGAGIGLVGGWLMGFAERREFVAPSFQQLGVVTIPLLCAAASEATHASMFIAAFVAGLAVQVGFREAGKHSVEFTEGWGQLLNLSVFMYFGFLVARDWNGFTVAHLVYAVLSLTVVRMLPVAIALLRSGLNKQTVLFMGWFGPRGLASIVLGMVYLEHASDTPNRATLRLAVMLAVFLSIFAHGLSAAPGARLLCRFVPLEQQSNPAMPPVSATRQTLLTQPTI